MNKTLHVREILANPLRFDGQSVNVYGIYMRFQENQCLADATPLPEEEDRELTDEELEEVCRLWLETDDKTVWSNVSRKYGDYSLAIVTGVYAHGRCGHLHMYRGQLTRVTRVEATDSAP